MNPIAEEALVMVRNAAAAARRAGELPEFLGALERIRVDVMLSPAVAPAAPAQDPLPRPARPDGLLTAEQAGRMLGRSRWWMYANKDQVGAMVPRPGGRYGFDKAKLEMWIKRRAI